MAALAGAKVALAEEYRMGGTCVIRGCIPKKLMVYASQFSENFLDAPGYGWTIPGKPTFDWPTFIANKDKEIARLEGLYTRNVKAAGVTIFSDRAVFEDEHTLLLAQRPAQGDGGKDPDRHRQPADPRDGHQPYHSGRRTLHHLQRSLSSGEDAQAHPGRRAAAISRWNSRISSTGWARM